MAAALSDTQVNEYFQRIAYTGGREPNLENLNAIIFKHITKIPFENLDVLCLPGHQSVSIDLNEMHTHLVSNERGSYCFVLNTYFMALLKYLGYSVLPVSGRVRLSAPTRDIIPARTHIFLLVTICEYRYIVDLGVGGASLSIALPFDPTGLEYTTPHEKHRVMSSIDTDGRELFFHQVYYNDWIDICDFTTERMNPIDITIGNWYTSAHPTSHFKNRLVVSIFGPPGTRKAILNHEFSIRDTVSGAVQNRTITTVDELFSILQEHFGIKIQSRTPLLCTALYWD